MLKTFKALSLPISVAAVLLLTGCANKIDVHNRHESFKRVSLPGLHEVPNPDFPSVVLSDTANRLSGSRAKLFYVKSIDGKAVENARTETSHLTRGKGFSVWTSSTLRYIPIRRAVFVLRAETYNAAPVIDLFRKDVSVTKTVAFTPELGKFYVVLGSIDEVTGKAEVYIADEETRAPIKVEELGAQ